MQKMVYLIIPCTKINATWIKDLKVKAQTIKLLEENIVLNLHDLRLANGFLDVIPKA